MVSRTPFGLGQCSSLMLFSQNATCSSMRLMNWKYKLLISMNRHCMSHRSRSSEGPCFRTSLRPCHIESSRLQDCQYYRPCLPETPTVGASTITNLMVPYSYSIAAVSCTSNGSQHDLGNCLGLDISAAYRPKPWTWVSTAT